ncbi:hypothetical protein, partial [Escherichia coli]|uniref:hypothetical protein n=1 Tax=Escherichia coli TaxID=562 RepID=UPI0019540E04
IARLEEPAKPEVLAFDDRPESAPRPARQAFLALGNTETGVSREVIVDLGRGEVTSAHTIPNGEAPYGQPPV